MIRGVNLLPPGLVRANRVRTRVHVWSHVVAMIVPIAVVVTIALRMSTDYTAHEIRTALQELRLQEESTRGESLELLAGASKLLQRAELAERVEREPDWSVLVDGVVRSLTPDLVLHSLRLNPVGSDAARIGFPGYVLWIRGGGRSVRDVSDFARRLEELDVFTSVRVGETSTSTVNGVDVAMFQIEGVIGQEPAK